MEWRRKHGVEILQNIGLLLKHAYFGKVFRMASNKNTIQSSEKLMGQANVNQRKGKKKIEKKTITWSTIYNNCSDAGILSQLRETHKIDSI